MKTITKTQTILEKIMKKAYIKPGMEVLTIEAAEIIATSVPQIGIIKPGEDGTTGEEILSNKRRGKWGNLWHEE